LAGTLNTRDLGGLPTADGRLTRTGRFLRSDGPLNLTQDDLDMLAGLPLTTVVDLRQGHELVRDPSRLQGRAGVEMHNIEIWGRIDASGAERPADQYDITAFYIAALDHAGPAFVHVIDVLTHAPGTSMFHCTAGKDRTGLVAALMLEAVGVGRDDIIADFALTEDRIEPLRERLLADAEKHGVPREQFKRLLGATPDLLVPALDHLDRQFGGAVPYLTRWGMSERTLADLRTKLLD
jgi:protein-tyrosine phosphatase